MQHRASATHVPGTPGWGEFPYKPRHKPASPTLVPSKRGNEPVQQPSSAHHQAAQNVAQAHAQHTAHQAAAAAPQSLAVLAPPPQKLISGESPADIRYTPVHCPGFTPKDKVALYGGWCVVVLYRLALAYVGINKDAAADMADTGMPAALLTSFGSIVDALGNLVDQQVGKKQYNKALTGYEEALAHWRNVASHVGTGPLDELSEQFLTASRHLVTLYTQILNGYESAYFPIAKANRLKAQRDLVHAVGDKSLARNRQPKDSPQWAQLDQELEQCLDDIKELQRVCNDPATLTDGATPITRRDLEKMQIERRALAKQIRHLEAHPPMYGPDPLPNLRLQLTQLQQDIKRLRPLFTKGQGPAAFLLPEDRGIKDLCLARDLKINQLAQPFVLGSTFLGGITHFVPAVPDIVQHGAGLANAGVSLVLTPLNYAYGYYDAEFSARSLAVTRQQSSNVRQQFGKTAELEIALSGKSAEHTVGRHLARNRLSVLKTMLTHFKQDQFFFTSRWMRALSLMAFSTPVNYVLGAAALGSAIALAAASAGAIPIAIATIGFVSLAGLLAVVTWRCWRSRRTENQNQKKQRAADHVLHVLGPEATHQLYTLSQEEFAKRMRPVIRSAPKGLRAQLQRHALLDNNKYLAAEWLAREFLLGAQEAERNQGAISDSWARQMAVNLGMTKADVDFLSTSRIFCRDDDHYLDTCRKTILAQLFNAPKYADKHLPHQRSRTDLQGSLMVINELLEEEKHMELAIQVRMASSPEALLPQHALSDEAAGRLEKQLANLRADLLLRHVDPQALRELRRSGDDKDDPRVWLLDALIDPTAREPGPAPMGAPAQPVQVTEHPVSYDLLDRAIKFVGRREQKKKHPVMDYLLGYNLSPTPNPMGTARQFLQLRQEPSQPHGLPLDDQVLDALAEWKYGELQKLPDKPSVPPGYASMNDWLLHVMQDIQKQCICNMSVQILDDKGRRRGEKLQKRFIERHNAAQALEQHLLKTMLGGAAAA